MNQRKHPDSPGTPRPGSGLHPRAAVGEMREILADALAEFGVELGFGIVGGGVAPMAESLARHLHVVHCRHEAGAAFAAVEASLATSKPVVVFATTGPGVVNALVGLAAARWEGAQVILVSGSTSPGNRGKWAFQETSSLTRPSTGVLESGALFHFAYEVEHAADVEMVLRRLQAGLARRAGFVAHLAVPIASQSQVCAARSASASPPPPLRVAPAGPSAEAIAECAELLARRFAIWVGYGARGASDEVRALAARTGAPVFCSPRAKGIFPENDPAFLGVSGFAGDPRLAARIAASGAERLLVLGSRLGEFSSFWDPELVPPGGLIQVDLEVDGLGTAFPSAPTLIVQSEIGAFLRALVEIVPASRAAPIAVGRETLRPRFVPGTLGPVRPDVLFQAIQQHVVDGSDAVVLTEAGNSFAWGNRLLRFATPGRYRTSMGFGSMGQATAGVIGAALARRGRAVAVVGDGAMLMNHEISTAVEHGIQATWIVLNDGGYGMIEHGMRAQQLTPVGTRIPPVNFAALARSVGCASARVTHEADLHAGLESAMRASGPFVLDVVIDPTVVAPFLQRVESLKRESC